MTAIRKEADTLARKNIDLEQLVMPPTNRGQDADRYIRELRDNDRV